MSKYVVVNGRGVNIRKVMSTLGNVPVGKLDKGHEFEVFEEYDGQGFGLIYTWGRISERPDENGQHRYVALRRSGGKVFCKKIETPIEQPPPSGFDDRLAGFEIRLADLEQRVGMLEKIAGIE